MARRGSSQAVKFAEMRRNAEIMELVCQGKTQAAVAGIVGLSVQRVTQIVAEGKLEALARKGLAADDKLEVELKKLEELEADARTGWLRSLEDSTTVLTKKARPRQEKNKALNAKLKKADKELLIIAQDETRKGQCGDPSFLKVRADIINTRLKLLNAFPRDEQGPAVVINQWPWERMASPVEMTQAVEVPPSAEVEAKIAAVGHEPSSNGKNGNGHA